MNDIVVYRENALTENDFEKLNALAAEALHVKPKYARILVKEKDEFGDIVERHEYQEIGYEIFKKRDLTPRLLESLQRPAQKSHIAVHLKRLEMHKRFSRGSAAWGVILIDLCKDLANLSEYAIVLACEKFRQDVSSPFFPDTAKILKEARDFDWAFKNLRSSEEKKPTVQSRPEKIKPTTKEKKRVEIFVKLSLKKSPLTDWQKRWIAAYKKSCNLKNKSAKC